MHIVVTGGTGLVGRALCKALHKQGHKVTIVGRNLPQWENNDISFVQANLIQGEIPHLFSDCDTIIHLAGAKIFHHWTNSYKQQIVDSRVKTAYAIYNFLAKQPKRPKSFISASAVGYYGDRGDEILTETSICGTGFLAYTCVEWEKAREQFTSLGMRTVSIRTPTVLSRQGGALSKMVPIFRLGLGGKLGRGEQWFPWIHINDLVNIYSKAVLDEQVKDSINAVAPELIRNIEFTKAIGFILKRPTLLTIPSFLLKLTLGELATTLLSSQKILPTSLHNFSFDYPTIQNALVDCVL